MERRLVRNERQASYFQREAIFPRNPGRVRYEDQFLSASTRTSS